MLSIVMGVRNRKDLLNNCLRSLSYQTAKAEVIVVDYGGMDHIREMVESFGFKYIYSNNTGMYSRCHALNIGIKNASGEYIMVTDADMIFDYHFVEEAEKALGKERLVMCYCHRLSPSGVIKDFDELDYYRMLEKSAEGHEWSIGGCQILHKDVWLEVGGFDEDLVGWGSEDWDLRDRVEVRGGIINTYIHKETSFIHQDHDPATGTAYRNDVLWEYHDKLRGRRLSAGLVERNAGKEWGKIETGYKSRVLHILELGDSVEEIYHSFVKTMDREKYEIYTVAIGGDIDASIGERFHQSSDFFMMMPRYARPAILSSLVNDIWFDVLHVWNSREGDRLVEDFEGRVIMGLFGDYRGMDRFRRARIKAIRRILKKRMGDITIITDNPANMELIEDIKMETIPIGSEMPPESDVKRTKRRCIWEGSGDRAMSLFLKIASIMPEYEFVLVIPGLPNRSKVLPGNVKIHIGLPRHRVYDLYRSSEIFVGVSNGIVLEQVRAMQCGCYVVANADLAAGLEGPVSAEDYKKAIVGFSAKTPKDKKRERSRMLELSKSNSVENMTKAIDVVYLSEGISSIPESVDAATRVTVKKRKKRKKKSGKRLKILNIAATSYMGGVEMILCNLIEHIDRSDYEIHTVVTTYDGPLASKYEEFSEYYKSIAKTAADDMANPALDGSERVEMLKTLIEKEKYDVLHIWNSEAGGVVAQDFKGKVVVGVYGDYHQTHPFFTSRIDLINKLKDKGNLTVIADNPGNADVFPNIDFRVVHTGIDDPDDMHVGRVENRCIWIGRVSPEKNVDLYLKIAEAMPDFEFYMVIPSATPTIWNPDTGRYVRMDKDANVKVFNDVTDRDEIYDLYKSSGIYVNTSTMEGTPLTLLESMKCECIPVCSSVGGIPYKIKDAGMLINRLEVGRFKRAIEHIFNMAPDKKAEMRSRILREGRLHTIDNMISEITEVWHDG